jgi:hypothetical protein
MQLRTLTESQEFGGGHWPALVTRGRGTFSRNEVTSQISLLSDNRGRHLKLVTLAFVPVAQAER